jgi:penicillin-binding protein 1A
LIERVRSATGGVLYQRPKTQPEVLVAPEHVAALNDMLGAVLTSGTGRLAALPDRPAAGKTGTSQGFRDAWFVGYTAHFTAGVWVGNDNQRAMHKVMGGSLPARLWHDVMVMAHEGHAPAPLTNRPPASRAVHAARGSAPLMPEQQIGSDFVERAIAAESSGTRDASPRSNPQLAKLRAWVGSAVDQLRDIQASAGRRD